MKPSQRMFISVLMIGVIWLVSSMIINNDIILPKPNLVFTNMLNQVQTSGFYRSIASTLWRMAIGFIVSLVVGVSLGFFSGMVSWGKDYLSPIVTMIKSIPNISYMIIALLWFRGSSSVIIVVFLIIFPMFYEASISGVLSLRRSLKDVLLIYPETGWNQLNQVYIPAMLPFILSNLSVALNLSFKVAIMAEVLGQPSLGIGKSMLLSKLTLDMVDLFSWTAWIILIGLLFDWALQKGITWVNKNYL